MVFVIKFPDYETIIPNQVYARDWHHKQINDFELNGKQFILPCRYTEPSSSNVVNYLRNKINQLDNEKEEHTSLESELLNLSTESLDHLLECDSCINSTENEGGDSFLYVTQGFIPYSILRQEEKPNLNWYQEVLNSAPFWAHPLRVKFSLDGGLPNRKEINTLVDHMTSLSESFYVNPNQYNIYEMQDLIENLYSGIDHKTNYLLDVSLEIMEFRALESINQYKQDMIGKDLFLNVLLENFTLKKGEYIH